MRFPKKSKIKKLISSDPTQRVLLNPWFDVERGIVLSSSGQNVLILPVEVEAGDVSGPLPIEAVLAVQRDGSSLKCTKEYGILPSGAAYPRDQMFDRYPPVEQLVITPEAYIEVSMNAKLLAELAAAMGTDVVKVKIAVNPEGAVRDGAPYVVLPHPSEPHVDGAVGALLPYRVARV